MAEEVKVKIIGREIIKPSSPTPSHLKIFNLSFIDQIEAAHYTSLVLFYSNNDVFLTSGQITKHLKKSLSEALTLFYPLAGRVKDNTVIECHDDGAHFVEAKFSGRLSTFLDQPRKDGALIGRFLPAATESPEEGTWPLLLVQATLFDCGGVAIGVCGSHKLVDAATLSIFLRTWAGDEVPDFEAASNYRSRDTFSFAPPPATKLKRVEGVTKRYVFDKSKIAALKAKFASDRVKQPTRVEVVTDVISRCLMGAPRSTSASFAAPVKPRYSLLMQSVNLRRRVEPPFPDNSAGNLAWHFSLLVENDIYEASSEPLECQLQDLVAKLRQGIKNFTENEAKRFGGDNGLQAIVESFMKTEENFARFGDLPFFLFSSWCKFQFYEADLGFGKPIHVTIPVHPYGNLVYVMDTRDGDGVEVVLILTKENMALFENRLLDIPSFASSN